MTYAMHQIQVTSLVRHDRSTFFEEYLSDVAERQLLLESATTEIGVRGDVRSGVCTVERDDAGDLRLERMAPVISYGEHTDGIL